MASQNQNISVARLAALTHLNPKERESCHLDHPPAYTPPSRSAIFDNISAYLRQSDVFDSGVGGPETASCPQISVSTDTVEDATDEMSPISLRISTRISVSSDNNIIALPLSTSEQANSIAKAVVATIQGKDWANGLPMIDENGRPRPVQLEVDAGITVEGASNIIGSEAVISDLLLQGSLAQRWSSTQCYNNSSSRVVSPKRRRRSSDIEPHELPSSKRLRDE
ncbi:hypothetical protein CTRI78_v003475 [Colletotrichum trifolii]|uniref:Uncharacterized protein n=1 Tax=Colletotrichum trifolii TaxID=5466 RepID=A0A4R8RJF8_COLTR|nr:hypothetical protein CTRI78_v003475 [Colletotrichum trifolii]